MIPWQSKLMGGILNLTKGFHGLHQLRTCGQLKYTNQIKTGIPVVI